MILRRPEHGTSRVVWTLACGAYLVHVAVAFEYFHHWSHAAAFRHVEAGSGFGPGIFVSYFFTLLWAIDVAWWWLAPGSRERRPSWIDGAGFGFMLVIIVNGAIVFASGAMRWVSATALLGLSLLWVRRRLVSQLRMARDESPR